MTKKTKVFYNRIIDKKQLKQIMSWAFNHFGSMKASYLADKLKDIGFKYSTKAGLSISIEDLKVPPIKKNLIKLANKKVFYADIEVERGEITEVERFQKVINTWSITSEALKDQVITYFRQTDPLNSIYMMAFSGARGNISQVRQLVGMRGLMADPNGQIIDLPIISNFREGLTITDYIISSYGARKGLVDTALRTADSGYLTRRLIDVAQDMITREKNCNTKDGISLTKIIDGNSTLISLQERIIGRVLASPLINLKTGALIADFNQEITPFLLEQIINLNIEKVVVRSPLTCSSSRSICQQCYGWNLAYGNLIDLGEAIGIIAAQSIGEPGTQLTMRTFHTGGVFTTEPSRQIRAQFSGKVVFSKNLKTQVTRTQYGEIAYISENEGSLNLITYNNLILELEIFPKTLIFIKNNSFVRKNDILFEIISKTRKVGGEKAFKYVSANQPGEVYLENRKLEEPNLEHKSLLKNKPNCLLWIFSGKVFNIPFNSKIKFQPGLRLCKNQILAESRLISINKGKINLFFETEQKQELNILRNSECLKNTPIYIEDTSNGIQECIIYGSKNRRIILKNITPFNNKKAASIGELINLNYRTKTGGTFYSTDFNEQREQRHIKKNKIKALGGTVFYIPEATYKIIQNTSQIYVKNGDYIKAKSEIFKNNIAKISGIVYLHKNKRLIKEIIIKPGQLILINKDKALKYYHQQLLYPGEILLDNIIIERLSFTEISTINGQLFLGIYPVIRYEIVNDKNELNFFPLNSFQITKDIKIEPFKTKFKNAKKINNFLPIQIVKQQIRNNSIMVSNNFLIKFDIYMEVEKRNRLKLNLIYLENISINNFIPNELKKEETNISILVQNDQFIESYTQMASYQVLLPEQTVISSIKEQFLSKERKVLLMTTRDYKKIYLEQANVNYQKNKLIKLGRNGKNNFIFQNSGFIYQIYGNSLILQKGSPYLFSQGARIEKRPGDLIKQGERIGQLVYERARTEDIVQGLPRVEEILEARKPKFEANIAIRPGMIIEIKSTPSELHIWVVPNNNLKVQKDFYKINYSQRLLIGLFEFINIGQPLNDAPINPHTLLDIYYSYFKSLKLFTHYNSAYRSFRKIQAILLNSVQAVYYSQGVSISDKHIEIIIKQMTGKVQIISSGDSPLLPDELVELKQVDYINNCLQEKEHTLFKPVILGITKASLKTNSFISAASFQHTTKILTEAAIQGKTDWLRGLKENVIVGRLIPAGTGFNTYSDIFHMEIKVPSFLTMKKDNLSAMSGNSHIKYKKLKDRIKFKFF
jgi:DNA-directed RNA polymerase subunit beta'